MSEELKLLYEARIQDLKEHNAELRKIMEGYGELIKNIMNGFTTPTVMPTAVEEEFDDPSITGGNL